MNTADAIVLALAHSLWIGIAIVAVVLASDLVLPRRLQHGVGVLAAAALVLAPILVAALSMPDAPSVALPPLPMATAPLLVAPPIADAAAASTAAPAASAPWRTWVAVAWFAGVALLASWHLGGWRRLRTIAVSGTALPPAIRALADDCLRRCALADRVVVRVTARLDVPAVIGWWRPVVLVPAALLGLQPEQLRALLLHELAHVRRHDWLADAVLVAAETLLFFHPAAWWLARRARRARELRCDERAVAAGAQPEAFARALLALAERSAPGRSVLAASGGDLAERVRRLLGVERPVRRWPAAAGIAIVVAGALVGLAAAGVQSAEPPPGPVPAAAQQPPPPFARERRLRALNAGTMLHANVRILQIPERRTAALGLPPAGQVAVFDAAAAGRLLAAIEADEAFQTLQAPRIAAFALQTANVSFVTQREVEHGARVDGGKADAGHSVLTTGDAFEICADGDAQGAIVERLRLEQLMELGADRIAVRDAGAAEPVLVEEPVLARTSFAIAGPLRVPAGGILLATVPAPELEVAASPLRAGAASCEPRGRPAKRTLPGAGTVRAIAVGMEVVAGTPHAGDRVLTPADAADVAALGRPVSIRARGERIDRVVASLASQAGLTAVWDDPVEAAQAVDIDVDRVPLGEALRSLTPQTLCTVGIERGVLRWGRAVAGDFSAPVLGLVPRGR